MLICVDLCYFVLTDIGFVYFVGCVNLVEFVDTVDFVDSVCVCKF